MHLFRAVFLLPLFAAACVDADPALTAEQAVTVPDAEVVVAGGRPVSLVTDGSTLFWIDNGRGELRSVAETGGAPRTLATGAVTDTPWSIAVDATHVYWIDPDDGAVRRTPRAGGATTTLAQGEGRPVAIAIDASHVYWTASTDAGSRLRRIGKTGGVARTLTTGSSLSALVVDGFFSYAADAYVLGGANQIVRVPRSGGARVVLSSDEDALGLAADSQGLYWKRFWTGDVRRASKWMPGAATLSSDGAGWGDLDVAAGHVWWTTGPILRRVPVAGGEPEVVHEAATWANSLAVDGDTAYLAVDSPEIAPREGSGAILRVSL